MQTHHSKTRIISIVNQKGGVGKTTTAVNLATSLAATKQRVLLLDMDPQGNATSSFHVSAPSTMSSTYEVLMGMKDINESTYAAQVPYLSIIPSKADLVAAEIELVDQAEREFWLKERWADLKETYDYILIDCPPAMSLLSINALVASKTVLIPIQCEYFALEGLAQLVKTIERVKEGLNDELRIEGIVLTMFDKRNMLNRRVAQEVGRYFGDLVFNSAIPRNVKLSEAPSFSMPGVLYDHTCAGAIAYMMLARELIEKGEKWKEKLS